MAYAPIRVYDMHRQAGRFQHRETNVVFEFSHAQEDEILFNPEYNMCVWMFDGTYRLAKVGRTVAYVIVDEDDGPVVEKWYIKNTKFWS